MTPMAHKRRKLGNEKASKVNEDDALSRGDKSLYTHESNLLALQVEDLLTGIRPKPSRRLERVDSVLRKLKTKIESIAAHTPISVRTSVLILLAAFH